MIAASCTWNQMVASLRAWHPQERITRLRNWALLTVGLLAARSACVPRSAAQLPLPIQADSRSKRLRRFLDNAAVEVPHFWAPLARLILQTLVHAGAPLRLLVDRTEIEARYNLLVVAVAFRRRAFPLLWVELGHAGCCDLAEQRRLLRQVREWIPVGAQVIVIGDREFRSTRLAQWIAAQGWEFVLRLKCDTRVETAPGRWVRLDQLGLEPGERRWLHGLRVAHSRCFGPVPVALIWARGAQEPWYLMTSLTTLAQAQRHYEVRGWCEQLWRDFKSQGFDLEATGVQRSERLERLLLGLALATAWVLWLGAEVVKRGLRRRVDEGYRRKLSLFQLGLRWLEHAGSLGQTTSFLLPTDRLKVAL